MAEKRILELVRICKDSPLSPQETFEQAIGFNEGEQNPLSNWIIRKIVQKVLGILPDPSTQFTNHVISGVAKTFTHSYTRHLESPAQFFYLTFLTCLGSLLADSLTLSSEISQQPRIYLLILGESADDRKSTGGLKPIDFFNEYFPGDFSVCYGVGSAEGLQKKIKKTPHQKLMLFFDEFKAFVSKGSMDSSVLLPCVNTLFESNNYETQTKQRSVELRGAYLSLVGCSTTATYENMWKPQFIDIGFPNRLFLVSGSGKRRFAIPGKISTRAKNFIKIRLDHILNLVGSGLEMPILPEAKDLFERWYLSLERSIYAKRLDTYALRFMPLLAINDGKTEVDLPTVYKTLDMMNWQLAIRSQLSPIDADNEIAKMEEKIRRKLRERPLRDRDLKRMVNAYRTGIWVYRTAIENLRKEGEIFNSQPQARLPVWKVSSSWSSSV